MQVIPLTGKAWVLDWDLEELDSVLGSIQMENWVWSSCDARGYNPYASLLHPVRVFVVIFLLLPW